MAEIDDLGFVADDVGFVAEDDLGFVPDVVTKGSSPETAIDESPLSLMQRAHLGWVRTPKDQEKLLKQQFEDVKSVPTEEGTSLVVKVGGQWFQANPAMEWKFSKKAASEAIGQLAQDTGEYGPRAQAAVSAAAAAFPASAAAGAPFGPAGAMVTGTAGALTAGAAASVGVEALEYGIRKSVLDPNTPGSSPYNVEELPKELAASAMLGIESVMLGKATEFGVKKTIGVISNVVKRFGNTPEGQQTIKKFLGMLGAKPEEIQARLMNPERNAHYDALHANDLAKSDPIKPRSLDLAQESVLTDLMDETRGLIRKEGVEFAAMKADPAVQKARFNVLADSEKSVDGYLFSDAYNQLKSRQILTEGGNINKLEVVKGSDVRAINFIKNNLEGADRLSYDQARAKISSIQSLLDTELHPSTEQILVQLKSGINQQIIRGLENAGQGKGVAYADIINKYREVKAINSILEKATTGNKRYALAEKMLKDKPNAIRDMSGALVKAGVKEDTLLKLVQIEGSRNAGSWFSNTSFGKFRFLPKPGAKLGAKMITAGANVRGAVGDIGRGIEQTQMAQTVSPYLEQAVKMFKSLPPEQLKRALTNPQMIDSIGGIVGGAAMSEKEKTEELLRQAGVK